MNEVQVLVILRHFCTHPHLVSKVKNGGKGSRNNKLLPSTMREVQVLELIIEGILRNYFEEIALCRMRTCSTLVFNGRDVLWEFNHLVLVCFSHHRGRVLRVKTLSSHSTNSYLATLALVKRASDFLVKNSEVRIVKALAEIWEWL